MVGKQLLYLLWNNASQLRLKNYYILCISNVPKVLWVLINTSLIDDLIKIYKQRLDDYHEMKLIMYVESFVSKGKRIKKNAFELCKINLNALYL